jgi:hypothetical protein
MRFSLGKFMLTREDERLIGLDRYGTNCTLEGVEQSHRNPTTIFIANLCVHQLN